MLTTADQVAKDPWGCTKAARKWGPTTWLQGLSLGDKRCSIGLCVHPTAPGSEITQLCLVSEEVPGGNRSPLCSGTETALHPHTTTPSIYRHRLIIHLLSLVDRLLYCAINKSIPCLPPPEFPRVHAIPAVASFKRDVMTNPICHNIPNTHFSSHWQS